ncbi:unnamed protein product [Moneuplotes crassus]|uniref:Uncharacterized protein n=1 Tax=Euplotes crassus TaxID=5936 RepID=A0AAD1U9R2_EUPCR|nr:unnamed protein product [Moneuplotes crassus]
MAALSKYNKENSSKEAQNIFQLYEDPLTQKLYRVKSEPKMSEMDPDTGTILERDNRNKQGIKPNKSYFPDLTGKADYKTRLAKADIFKKVLPKYPKSILNQGRKSNIYTPRTDKLDGYAQFPNPIDNNEPLVKQKVLKSAQKVLKNSKSKTQEPDPKALSKNPQKFIDSYEFYEKIKENKRKDVTQIQSITIDRKPKPAKNYTSYLSGKRVSDQQRQVLEKEKILERLKNEISSSRPFQNYVLQKHHSGDLERSRSGETQDFRSSTKSLATSGFERGKKDRKSMVAGLISELPALNKKIFKSLSVEEQKTYRYAKQLEEYSPGCLVSGQIINRQQDIELIGQKRKKKIQIQKSNIKIQKNKRSLRKGISTVQNSNYPGNFQSNNFDLETYSQRKYHDKNVIKSRNYTTKNFITTSVDQLTGLSGQIYDSDSSAVEYKNTRQTKTFQNSQLMSHENLSKKLIQEEIDLNHSLDAHSPKIEPAERPRVEGRFETLPIPRESDLKNREMNQLINLNPSALKSYTIAMAKDKRRLASKKKQDILKSKLILQKSAVAEKRYTSKIKRHWQ